jgi:hypothetical protein
MNLSRLHDVYITYLHKGVAVNKNNNPQLDAILTTAENLFISMKNKDYTAIWNELSDNSRKAVLNDAWEKSKIQGRAVNKEELSADFKNGGARAGAYWDTILTIFDPDIVLEQSRWEMGKIKQSEAEIILYYLKSKSPTILKLYKEGGKWKVGWEESFGARRLNPF